MEAWQNRDRSFGRMKVEGGLMESFNNRGEKVITKRFKNLSNIDSRELIEFATRVMALEEGLKLKYLVEKKS